MDQPPLIDIEPESGKSSGRGCGGCLSRLLPLLTGLMLVVVLLMVAAWFIWGKGLRQDGATAEGSAKAVERHHRVEKTGIAGLMDKAKRALGGGDKEEKAD